MSRPSEPESGRSELKATISLAVPIVLVQVGMQSMGVVDTAMAGHVSARVLASVALGNLYFFSIAVFAIGTLMALDPLVAQALGAKDQESARRAIQRGMVIAVGLSVITALVMLPAEPLLRLARQPADVLPDTVRYLRISIVGVVPYLGFIVLRQSLQAMHRVAAIVWALATANLANAFLNWVFIYGHLGSPALGASGSAIATAASRWFMALLLMWTARHELRPYLQPLSPALWDWGAIARMLRLGAPIGLQQMLEVGAFQAIGLLMGVMGPTKMAAHQIALQLAALTFMVPMGVGASAAVRVGRAIGAGDRQRANSAIHAGYVAGVGFMTITAALFLFAPRLLAQLFTSDANVTALAAVLIPIAGVFQVFDGAQAVGAGVLRGAGDTTAPLWVMLASYWLVGIPVSWYFGFHTSLGPTGLWYGFVVSLAAVAVFLLLRIRVVFRRDLSRVLIDATS
jgi:MATE family multidrug resistance protein